MAYDHVDQLSRRGRVAPEEDLTRAPARRSNPLGQPGELSAASEEGRLPMPVAAITHAIDVLKAISESEAMLGVNEIARRVSLHKSTVSRILGTLQVNRLVDRDPESGRFKLGVGLVALAGPMLANLDLVKLARPTLQAIAQQSGETVSLYLWDGREAVSVEQALGASAVKHFAPPGRRNPAHCTATGKAFLAALPPEAVAEIMDAGLRAYTPHTMIDWQALDADLEKTRARGYAVNQEEFVLEVCAVAAVIRDLQERVAAVIGITVPKYRFTPRHRKALADMVLRAADELSRRLGHSGKRRPEPFQVQRKEVV